MSAESKPNIKSLDKYCHLAAGNWVFSSLLLVNIVIFLKMNFYLLLSKTGIFVVAEAGEKEIELYFWIYTIANNKISLLKYFYTLLLVVPETSAARLWYRYRSENYSLVKDLTKCQWMFLSPGFQ